MKILFFSNSARSFINFRLNLLLECKKKYSEILILCPKDQECKILENLGFTVINIKMNSHSKNIFFEIILLFKIFTFYKKFKPNIVCHFTIKPNIYGSFISRLLKIKTINNITGLGETFINKNYFLNFIILLYKLTFFKVNHIFFQNNEDKNIFKKFNIIRSTFSILPGSGVNIDKYSTAVYPKSANISFLFIGRIIKEKGIRELIEAARLVKKKNNNIIFNFIGEKFHYLSKDLDAIFIKAIKDKIINYYGYQNDIINFINQSHAVILPSYREGLSHSLLIAGSMSRPLIVSNVPGCIDLVEDNYNGFLFEAKNSIAIVNSINKFLDLSNDKMKQMGLRSKHLIQKNFNENIVINEYIRVIESI